MARPKKYPQELIERGVRLALESERPIAHIAVDPGDAPRDVGKHVHRAEAGSGKRRDLMSGQEREEIRRLGKENCELRRANEIVKSASVSAKELDPDHLRERQSHRAGPHAGRHDFRWWTDAGVPSGLWGA